MNIEESIKPLRILMSKYKQIDEMNNFDHELALVIDYTELSAIETLLKVYEKQSKEIEELKDINKKLEARKYMLNAITGEVTAIPIDNNYISKDKIKAKIEEVQNMKAKAKDIVFKSSLNYIETELQSLLEKE